MDLQFQSYYKQLGLNISYYRKLRNLTQMELAEFTDLSRTHISNIEAPNVKTSISLDTLFKIAEVLQVPPRVLLDFPVEEKLTHPNGSRLDRNRSDGKRPGETAVIGSVKCAHNYHVHKK